jgi:glycosyltransferase involved in cell wall biosynthesis
VKPKIGIVAAGLDPPGGQAVQARILHDSLRADGFDVEFVPINPLFPRFLHWSRRVRYLRTIVNQATYLPSLRKLRTVDVAHVFSASYASFFLAPAPAILAARSLRKKIVLHYHSGEAEDHLARSGSLLRPWFARVDALVVPSRFLCDIFARRGISATVIPNVIDLGAFPYCERRTIAPKLLSNRNFETHYRVENTIQAFALIRKQHPLATLVIAGSGSKEGRLREVARDVPGIRFVGRVPPDRMVDLYREADVFLNSSVIDNQPISVLEAFAVGLPVVSTPTGDLSALVRDGETGLVVPPDDPRRLAGAVERLLAAPDLAISLARRAREEVERFTWPHVGPLWRELYAKAVR